MAYKMTPARRAALRKAQRVSAAKRKRRRIKRATAASVGFVIGATLAYGAQKPSPSKRIKRAHAKRVIGRSSRRAAAMRVHPASGTRRTSVTGKRTRSMVVITGGNRSNSRSDRMARGIRREIKRYNTRK